MPAVQLSTSPSPTPHAHSTAEDTWFCLLHATCHVHLPTAVSGSSPEHLPLSGYLPQLGRALPPPASHTQRPAFLSPPQGEGAGWTCRHRPGSSLCEATHQRGRRAGWGCTATSTMFPTLLKDVGKCSPLQPGGQKLATGAHGCHDVKFTSYAEEELGENTQTHPGVILDGGMKGQTSFALQVFYFLPDLQRTCQLLWQRRQDRVRGHQATSTHKDPGLAIPCSMGRREDTDSAPACSHLPRHPRAPAVRKGRCPERTCRDRLPETSSVEGAGHWAGRLGPGSKLSSDPKCSVASPTLASPGPRVLACNIGRLSTTLWDSGVEWSRGDCERLNCEQLGLTPESRFRFCHSC